MAPRVYDIHGSEHDMGWLRLKYGNVRFLDAGPGQKFRLVRVDETSGPATIVVRVLDVQGASMTGQPVANHWPDPNLPSLSGGGLQTLWHPAASGRVQAGWLAGRANRYLSVPRLGSLRRRFAT